MRRFLVLLIMPALGWSASTATQSATFFVLVSNNLTVDQTLINLNIIDRLDTSVTDTSSTYSMETNEKNKKITGILSDAMPTHTSLSIELAASLGVSEGAVILNSTIAQSLVINLNEAIQSSQQITYVFSIDPLQVQQLSGTTTCLLTLTDE